MENGSGRKIERAQLIRYRGLVARKLATPRELAVQAGVAERTMQKAVYGETYRDVPKAVGRPGKHGRENWWLRGSRSPNSKLTPDNVMDIWNLRGKVRPLTLARRYGVSTATIRKIWSGESWAWLTGARLQA